MCFFSLFFQSLMSKEVVIPIIIGIVASWLISKYFFYKKKPSLLADAKRYKTTNFGGYRNVTKETATIPLETKYFGSWSINANGTVTDNTNKLSWVRAPWGTTWNGTDFIGNPQPIKWRDASDLFGKGIFIRSPFPALSLEKRPTNFKENYTKGSCKVSFADSDKWRLPTAAEADILQFYSNPSIKDRDVYNLREKEATVLKQQLFPYMSAFSQKDGLKYKLWTADIADTQCAWSFHGTTLDDTKKEEPCYVLFVKDY